MEAELRDGVEERRGAPPGKRLLTHIEDLVEPADGDTANSRNRNESMEEHHPSRNSVFKRPAIPGTSSRARHKMRKPTTAAAQGSAKEENPDQVDVSTLSTFDSDPNLLQTKVEIEIPQSCRDILDTNICPVVITGPQDIGFIPDLDFEQPLEPFPATESLIQDFSMDWGPASFMTEEDLPPMDTIDDHLLQTAGDTGETVTRTAQPPTPTPPTAPVRPRASSPSFTAGWPTRHALSLEDSPLPGAALGRIPSVINTSGAAGRTVE